MNLNKYTVYLLGLISKLCDAYFVICLLIYSDIKMNYMQWLAYECTYFIMSLLF